MDLQVDLHLNGERRVQGILKGYDPFMNIVLDEAWHVKSKDERRKLGTVVIRGNSIKFWENIDRMK
jgi:small nuclear ribonucleoprotein G